MNAAETVRSYYETLRRGEPLSPYFLEREKTVKFGVSERLAGYDAVAEGLREQTRTTADWTVDSRSLVVETRDDHSRFSDEVGLGWTALDEDARYEFDTRWSGALARVDDDWQFGTLHVSTAVDSLETVAESSPVDPSDEGRR